MGFDIDLFRDLLVLLGADTPFVTDDDGGITCGGISFDAICQALTDYRREAIFQAVQILSDGGYIDATIDWADNELHVCHVNYMTFAGYELLEKIKDSKRWQTVKSGLSAVKNYSITAIEAIASGITTAAISAYLARGNSQP